MPVPTPIYRKQPPIVSPNAAGGTVPQKAYKTLVYRETALELNYQLTLTAPNNTVAGVKRGDGWGVIKNFQWLNNGSDALRTFNGDDLWWLNYFWYGITGRREINLGDLTTANPTIDSTLIMPAWMPRAFHPFDTAVDGMRYNDSQFVPTFGTFTDVHANATGFQSLPQLNFVSHEQILPPNVQDRPNANWVMDKMTVNVPGANQAFPIPLPPGFSIASVIMNVQDTSNPTNDSSSLVTNVKIFGAGGRAYADLPWSQVVQYGRQKHSIADSSYKTPLIAAGSLTDAVIVSNGQAIADVTGAFSQAVLNQNFANIAAAINALQNGLASGRILRPGLRISPVSNDDAWGYINLCDDGFLGEALPNPQDARIEVSSTGACTLNILLAKVVPLVPQQG